MMQSEIIVVNQLCAINNLPVLRMKLNRAKLQNLKNIASVIRDYIPQLMFQVPAEYPNLSTDINIQSLEGLLDIPNLNC